jgi:hypothetical protein
MVYASSHPPTTHRTTNEQHRGAQSRRGMTMENAYTLMGYTITNAEQARTVLLVAKLQGKAHVVQQALSIIARYEA